MLSVKEERVEGCLYFPISLPHERLIAAEYKPEMDISGKWRVTVHESEM